MKIFFRFIVNNPKKIIFAILSLTIYFGLQLPGLTKDNSIDKMLPDGDPILEYTENIENIFDSDEFIIVAVESKEPFSRDTVAKLSRMTYEFQSIPEVLEVISPTNTKNVRGSVGTMHAEPLIDANDLPRSKEDLESYRQAIQSKSIFKGSIISDDGQTFGFVLRLRKDLDKKALVTAVRVIVEKEKGPEKIYFSGSPVINLQVGAYMAADMAKFFPLVILVILATFWFSFKSVRGMILPFLSLLISVIWTLGVMSLLKVPLSVIGTMIPSLLMAVGSSYGIHMLTQYYEEMTDLGSAAENLLEAIMQIGPTIALAGLTTTIGFGSLMLNDTPILREFGFFCALGICFNALLSLIFIPSCLALLKPPDKSRREKTETDMVSKLLKTVANLNSNKRFVVLTIFGFLAAFSLAGYPRLFVETNAVNFFKENDAVRKTISQIGASFGGTIPIRTIVDSKEIDTILSPEYLKQIEAFQSYLESFDRVGKTISIADMIKDMNMALHEGDPDYYALPDTLASAEQYLFLYSLASDPNEFSSLIDDSHSMAAVVARLKQVNDKNEPLGTRETKEILDGIQGYINQNFSPELSVVPTGRARNIVRTSDYIVKGLLKSMVLAVLLIFFTSSIVFRSLVAGIFSIIPVSIALLLNFGTMSWLGIPLDIATTLISSIAIGIGVDDSIHYIIRHVRERRNGAPDDMAAMLNTIRTSGRAIFYTSLALVMGFSVLLVASFKPVVYFGGLTALTMINTTLGALFILPLAIVIFKPKFCER